MMKAPILFLAGALAGLFPSMNSAENLKLYAAGSLRAAMGEVADTFEAEYGAKVERVFGPSGLLRQRIENGEPASVFASANMEHPLRLEKHQRGGPVALFARNKLCALAQEKVRISTDSLLDMLLDPGIRVGTSTPKADPSGDYAWELFHKTESLRPGAFATLNAKALRLTGGPTSEKPPEGRNQYAWVMETDKADVFLTYCTNAVLARSEAPSLQMVQVPAAISVGADYGLMVLHGASDSAWRFAMFVLSPRGQKILSSFGFDAAAVPAKK